MKTALIALSAALIAAAPAALARNSQTQDQQHQASRKHARIVSDNSPPTIHASSVKNGHPGAFGYAPSAPKDYTTESSRQAGGGGGGGSGM